MRGKKGVCAFFWMVYLESDIMFFFFLLHSWIKNFRRNADVVYFHRPPVCLCKKKQKKPHNIPPPTQHTRIHNTYTHSTIDARIFFRSRARRSGARSVACTPLSLPPWLAFDVLPRMSSGVKERVFFSSSPPNTHTNTHIHPPRIWARQFAVAHSSSPLSWTPTPSQPQSKNRIRTSFYCYLVAGLQSPWWPFKLLCVVQQMCSLQQMEGKKIK